MQGEALIGSCSGDFAQLGIEIGDVRYEPAPHGRAIREPLEKVELLLHDNNYLNSCPAKGTVERLTNINRLSRMVKKTTETE